MVGLPRTHDGMSHTRRAVEARAAAATGFSFEDFPKFLLLALACVEVHTLVSNRSRKRFSEEPV